MATTDRFKAEAICINPESLLTTFVTLNKSIARVMKLYLQISATIVTQGLYFISNGFFASRAK